MAMNSTAMAATPSLPTTAGGGGRTVPCSPRFLQCCNCSYLQYLNRATTHSRPDSSLYAIIQERTTHHHNLRFRPIFKAADSTQPTTSTTSADKSLVPDDEFSLAKVHLKRRFIQFFYFSPSIRIIRKSGHFGSDKNNSHEYLRALARLCYLNSLFFLYDFA